MAFFGKSKEDKAKEKLDRELTTEEKEKNSKKVLKHLNNAQEHLDTDEKIIDFTYGLYDSTMLGESTKRNGILAATSKRILFYGKKMMGYEIETIDYPKISSVDYSKGMVFGKLKVYTSNNDIEFQTTMEHTTRNIMNLIKEKSKQTDNTSAVTPKETSPAEKLKELKELLDLEIISQDEFDEKKEKLLKEL